MNESTKSSPEVLIETIEKLKVHPKDARQPWRNQAINEAIAIVRQHQAGQPITPQITPPDPYPLHPSYEEQLALVESMMTCYDTPLTQAAGYTRDLLKTIIALQSRDIPPDDSEWAWCIKFDDTEVADEVFMGCGAKDAALKRFDQISMNWNAHLFREYRRDQVEQSAMAMLKEICASWDFPRSGELYKEAMAILGNAAIRKDADQATPAKSIPHQSEALISKTIATMRAAKKEIRPEAPFHHEAEGFNRAVELCVEIFKNYLKLHSPSEIPVVDERAAFESAYSRYLCMDKIPDAWGEPIYKHSHVDATWKGWQARAAWEPKRERNSIEDGSANGK